MNDHVAWELINRHKAEMLGMFNSLMSLIAATVPDVAIFPTLAAARAATIAQDFVLIKQDVNLQGGVFLSDSTYTVLLQGADGFTDAAGKIFKRFQNE